jgi:hypothetical protein
MMRITESTTCDGLFALAYEADMIRRMVVWAFVFL